MILRITLAAALFAASPAHALLRLSEAESLASRSADLIGAAAACGVSEDRLSAFGQAIMERVRKLAESPTQLERAHARFVSRVRVRAERTRDQRECPAAIWAFERAGRN